MSTTNALFWSNYNGSLFYSSSGEDYQTVVTIVLLQIINDQEFIDFLAGNGVTPSTDAYEPLQRADMFQVVMIPTEEEIALGSTYSAMLTLLVTTIQRVHNELVRVYVDHDEKSTTVRVFTEALDISATTQHPQTPEVVTSLLHQLLEDTNLRSFVQAKLAEQRD